MSTSINIPTIDSPYAAVIGRYGTYQITAICAQEEDGRPVPFVRLEGIGKRRRAIKGGIGISAETMDTLCRESRDHPLKRVACQEVGKPHLDQPKPEAPGYVRKVTTPVRERSSVRLCRTQLKVLCGQGRC